MSESGRNDEVRSATELRPACDNAALSGEHEHVCRDKAATTGSQLSDLSAQSARYAIYVRTATDEASRDRVREQVLACNAAAADFHPQLTLTANGIFSDVGKSGNNLDRCGLKALIERAQQQPRPFEHVFVADSSRLFRNAGQVLSTAAIFRFHGITLHFVDQRMSSADPNFNLIMSIFAMSDQTRSDLHRAKVRRELRRRILENYSPGGKCYGYESSEKVLCIARSEAATIRRIYSDFAAGVSAVQIAMNLNARQVPGPRKATWKSQNVYAVLRRSLYRGRLLWARTRTVVAPETGKRIKRPAPRNELLWVDAPHLRIVDADLALAVDERLASLDHEGTRRVKS